MLACYLGYLLSTRLFHRPRAVFLVRELKFMYLLFSGLKKISPEIDFRTYLKM